MSLLPTRTKKVHSKVKSLEWLQNFPHYKYVGFFFRRSRAGNSGVHDRIWPNFELIQDFMVVLVVTCKNEDLITSEGARLTKRLNVDFSDTQGQITP